MLHPAAATTTWTAPGRRRILAVALAATAGAALAGGIALRPGAASASSVTPVATSRTFASLLYDTDSNVGVLASGRDANGNAIGPGLTPSRGGVRQEPSGTNMLGMNARDNSARIAKINAKQLLGKSSGQMATMIRNAINGPCVQVINGIVHNFGCASHKVAIDEVSPAFATPHTGGRGWLGRNFSNALITLSRQGSRWGGSYASRVAVYVDAGVTVSIYAGKGKNHNLNGYGRPQYAVFSDVMPGLARAGALWLEMYQGVHYGTGTAPLTPIQWKLMPTRFAGYLAHFGGRVSHVHFMFGDTGAPTSSCTDPQACTWALAAQAGLNRTILGNGPGEYRLGTQAASWLAQFNAYFPSVANAASPSVW
jgi:hypothetical protein